jgi:Competence protein J (ComJ)
MATFSLEVSYAQLAVFDAHLASPFNDWSDAHADQGFSWRPGSVSFATLEPSGPITVTLTRSRPPSLRDEPLERAIVVPFTVPSHGELEIATISGSVPVQLPEGEYALTFQHGRSLSGAMWATLTFERVASPVKAEILRADAALTPPGELVMTAQPA